LGLLLFQPVSETRDLDLCWASERVIGEQDPNVRSWVQTWSSAEA
jgi:hypothetical protein